MAGVTFDTLKFANTLKAAGVPDKQAEAEAAAFAEVMQVNFKELATKEELKREIVTLRDEMKQEFKLLRQEMKEEIQKLNARFDTLQAKVSGDINLLRWMVGAVLTALVGILIRLFLYAPPH